MTPQTTPHTDATSADYRVQHRTIRLLDGQSQPATNVMAVVEPQTRRSPAALKGSLYVLIDPGADSSKSEHASQQIAHTIQQTFYANPSASSVSALRAAIRMANKALYYANIKVAANQRVTVGVVAIVLKERELSIIQVAPAHVSLLSQSRLHTLPDMPDSPPLHQAMLGASLFIEPAIYHHQLSTTTSTSVLAGTSTLAHHLTSNQAEMLLHSHNPETIIGEVRNLGEHHAIPWFHALTITHTPAAGDSRPAQPATTPAVIGPWFAQLHRPNPPHLLAHTAASGAGETVAPAMAHTGPANAAYPRMVNRLGEQDTLPDPPRPAVGAYASAATTLFRRLLLSLSRLRMADTNLKATSMRIPRRTSASARSARGYRQSRPDGADKPSFSWSQFLSLVLLVTLLIIYGNNLSQQHSDQRDQRYVQQAQDYLERIPHAADRASAIQLLEHADQSLNQVRASPMLTTTHPQLWTAFHETESAYEQSAAMLYHLSYIEPPDVLATHPLEGGTFDSIIVPPPTTELTDTASLQALHSLYALDTSATPTTLYRVPREGGVARPFLQGGDLAQNTQVGTLLSQVWHNHNIALIEQDEATTNLGFYQRTGDTWAYLRLGESTIQSLQSRLDAEVYNGHLYLWNTNKREILKYASDNYNNIPWPWLSQTGRSHPELSGVVDMAIDGHIYLLLPNGHLLLFHSGQFKREIVPGRMTPPIEQASRVFVPNTPNNAHIYLLDPPNQRILQLDKERGTLIQQITVRPDSPIRFDGLRDFAVDTSTGRTMIYVANNHQILRFPLPQPPDTER